MFIIFLWWIGPDNFQVVPDAPDAAPDAAARTLEDEGAFHVSKKVPLFTNCRMAFHKKVAAHEGQVIVARICMVGADRAEPHDIMVCYRLDRHELQAGGACKKPACKKPSLRFPDL